MLPNARLDNIGKLDKRFDQANTHIYVHAYMHATC